MYNNINPCEGYFWIIGDKVVGVKAEVPEYDYDYALNGKTHQNSWNEFKDNYLVNGETVDFDYFPRGRIMIDPEYDIDDMFESYSCIIFLDKCINTKHHKDLIAEYYNLNLTTIPHITWTMLGERAGIDHYSCHNCKK